MSTFYLSLQKHLGSLHGFTAVTIAEKLFSPLTPACQICKTSFKLQASMTSPTHNHVEPAQTEQLQSMSYFLVKTGDRILLATGTQMAGKFQ